MKCVIVKNQTLSKGKEAGGFLISLGMKICLRKVLLVSLLLC